LGNLEPVKAVVLIRDSTKAGSAEIYSTDIVAVSSTPLAALDSHSLGNSLNKSLNKAKHA